MPAQANISSPADEINVCRSTEEIETRIEQLKSNGLDVFGFQRSDLIDFLPFDAAKPYLRDEVKEADWTPSRPDLQTLKKLILDYMPFAWDKANNCRGLSAGRSVEHMKAWLWLLNDDLAEKLDDIYDFYGKTCLRTICEKYGWDWRQWDDGAWRNRETDDGIAAPTHSSL